MASPPPVSPLHYPHIVSGAYQQHLSPSPTPPPVSSKVPTHAPPAYPGTSPLVSPEMVSPPPDYLTLQGMYLNQTVWDEQQHREMLRYEQELEETQRRSEHQQLLRSMHLIARRSNIHEDIRYNADRVRLEHKANSIMQRLQRERSQELADMQRRHVCLDIDNAHKADLLDRRASEHIGPYSPNAVRRFDHMPYLNHHLSPPQPHQPLAPCQSPSVYHTYAKGSLSPPGISGNHQKRV
eukprot:PhF_6_TR12982/c0_g1_i1/m.20526